MTTTSLASYDASDSCVDFDDAVHWLLPRGSAQVESCANVRASHLFRLTASLSLSAFMTFGSISAAVAPAAARTAPASDLAVPNEPTLAIELPSQSLDQSLQTLENRLEGESDTIGTITPTAADGTASALDPVLGNAAPVEIVARALIPITPEIG